MMRRRAVGAAVPEPVPTRVPVDIEVGDEQDDVAIDTATLAALARAVLAAEGVDGPAELTLTFVDETEMAELNGTHMGESGPTDVLAFPLDDPDEVRPAGMSALLGDVVICPAVASRYAAEHGRSAEHELALLVVHGVLHVLGHDHAEPDESVRMRDHERRHLRAFVDPAFDR